MKIKVLTFLMIVAMMVAGNAYAEDNNGVKWGVKASGDAVYPTKWHLENNSVAMFKRGWGFTAGPVCDIQLGNHFYLEPGVLLSYSQYRYKDLIIPNEMGDEIDRDPKVYKWGIQVPVLAGYQIGITDRFKLNVFTGPQIRYAFAGKISFKNKEALKEAGEYFDLWGADGQRRFDCSWKVGIGVPLDPLTVSMEFDFGMTDILKGSMSCRENRLAVGLAYFF